jgi:hypothetical protein
MSVTASTPAAPGGPIGVARPDLAGWSSAAEAASVGARPAAHEPALATTAPAATGAFPPDGAGAVGLFAVPATALQSFGPPRQLGAGLALRTDAKSGGVLVSWDPAIWGGAEGARIAGAVAQALARDGVGRAAGFELTIALDGAGGTPLGAYGTAVMQDGTRRAFGAIPGIGDGRPVALLHLRSGTATAARTARTEALGDAYVEYLRPTRIPVDLTPGPAAAPLPGTLPTLSRVEDTRALVTLGPGGVDIAVTEAARLQSRAAAGTLRLEELAPGQGVSTWDGSPLSLRLAGVEKPLSAGVAAGPAAPPRVEVFRDTSGGYAATRPPGNAVLRTESADAALRGFVAFGLDPAAAAGVPPALQPLAAMGREGFEAALAEMERVRLAWWLPQSEICRRQEAWAGTARAWAAEISAMAAGGEYTGAATGGFPAEAAAALAAVAGRHGALAAWNEAMGGGLDLGTLLGGAGEERAALGEAFAGAAALMAARLNLVPDRAVPGGAAGATGLAKAREDFATAVAGLSSDVARLFEAYGGAVLAEGSGIGTADALAVSARLGRAARTDLDRGYVAPSLRTARLNLGPEEQREEEQRPRP